MAWSAMRVAVVGNAFLAKQRVQASLAMAKGRNVEGLTDLAFALSGDTQRALQGAGDLARLMMRMRGKYKPSSCRRRCS